MIAWCFAIQTTSTVNVLNDSVETVCMTSGDYFSNILNSFITGFDPYIRKFTLRRTKIK